MERAEIIGLDVCLRRSSFTNFCICICRWLESFSSAVTLALSDAGSLEASKRRTVSRVFAYDPTSSSSFSRLL